MRRGNLQITDLGKVTSRCSRDLLRERHKNITQRRGRDVPLRRHWVFHMGLTGDVIEIY